MLQEQERAAAEGSAPSLLLRILRAAEFVLLFFGVPLLYVFRALPLRTVIPVLILFSLACLALLLRDRSFDRRRLWNGADFGKRLVRVLAVYLVAGAALLALVLVLDRNRAAQGKPELFLSFVKRSTVGWMIVMSLYPLLSVYPQELIFRAFLFHRYRALFPEPWMQVCASAVAFGFVHVLFRNWVAVVLSALGGFLFARTYRRTDSLLMSGVEHALYGDLIFTVGLGTFFYHGTARFVSSITG